MATLSLADYAFSPPRNVVVSSRLRETHDTVSLEFDDPGATYEPGTFNMLYAFPAGEVPVSISAVAGERVTHTVRSVGPVSTALTRLQAGSPLGVRGPFGEGWPLSRARGKDVVVVAGGLGLAPLRPAVHALLADRASYGRLAVLVGARTPADLLFRSEVERWRSRFDLQVDVTVDAAPAGWQGEVGVVTTLFRRLEIDPDEAIALVCGPEIMMRFAARGLADLGIAPESIWLSLERNMQCGAGLCGHCQLGPFLVCRDGPVLPYSRLQPWLAVEQL